MPQLPEPHSPAVRALVRKCCALEARARGEDIIPLGCGAPTPARLIGVTITRLSPAEQLVGLEAAALLVWGCVQGAGEDIVLRDRHGQQVCGADVDEMRGALRGESA